jgi:hypothetical protein
MAESLVPGCRVAPLERSAAVEQAAQNFVDIMIKIHNKIQNIKSLKSGKGEFRPSIRKTRQRDCFSSWVYQGH